MGKIVNKLTQDGKFICSYKNIQQAANDLNCNESTLRKPLKKRGWIDFKGFILSTSKDVFANEIISTPKKHHAKILLLDIETAPIKCYAWGPWNQNINPVQIIQDWFIISWSAKWLFEDEMFSDVLTSIEADFGNDKRIVENLWDYLDEADIVIAHNGRQFDIPKIYSRFLIHGMVPPAPFKQIDTLEVARKNFGFTHNKLDYLAEKLGLPRKIETSFQLWIDCLNGDDKALDDMLRYNQHDVLILEDIYVILRPYITNHPNLNLFIDSDGIHCPKCGGSHLIHTGKYYTTTVNKFEVIQCAQCGGHGRGRFSDGTINNSLVNVAK
jgi:hypothetical protein